MALKENDSNIIDCHPLFQDARVAALHETFHKHETYLEGELFNTIKAVKLVNVITLSPDAREKFQSLCGRLHKIDTKMTIDSIVDETQILKKKGVENPLDIEALRLAVEEALQNYPLSDVDLGLLDIASTTLDELSSEKIPDMVNTSHITSNQESQVLPESKVKGTKLSADWEEAEQAFELLELASLFYQGKIHEGLKMLKTLSREIPLPAISESSPPEEIAAFIQEAVVKSFEIGRKDGYAPSSQEILELLEEASSFS